MHFTRGNVEDLLAQADVTLRLLSKIVSHMRNNFVDEVEMQDCVGLLLSLGLEKVNLTTEVDVQEALQFLCQVWSEYPENIAKADDQGEKIIQELRKKCRQQSTSTKVINLFQSTTL